MTRMNYLHILPDDILDYIKRIKRELEEEDWQDKKVLKEGDIFVKNKDYLCVDKFVILKVNRTSYIYGKYGKHMEDKKYLKCVDYCFTEYTFTDEIVFECREVKNILEHSVRKCNPISRICIKHDQKALVKYRFE